MAKFTVFFKDKAIASEVFDSGVVHIGRDETNDLTVDSLAIAPAHAAVTIKPDACLIKQLNDDFPLVINNVQSKEAILNNNDRINIGKHYIVYSHTESIGESAKQQTFDQDVEFLNQKLKQTGKPVNANVQILDGPHIGRILNLKKTMTRIGNSGTGVVVISRRKDGYFISALEDSAEIKVNQHPVGDKTVQLKNNDVITIDKTSMQFFVT